MQLDVLLMIWRGRGEGHITPLPKRNMQDETVQKI